MKYFLFIFIILGLVFVYLNRTYTHIYDNIGSQHLPNPNLQTVYQLKDNNSPEKTLTVAALGDSLTAGVGAKNPEESFPYLFAQSLNQQDSVTLINLGQPQARLETVISEELPQALSQKPDYIILLIGINDMHNLTPLDKFQTSYNYLLQQLTSKTSAQVIILSIPYLGNNSLMLPPWSPVFDFRTKQYNQIIFNLSQKYRVKYIDLYALTKEQFKNNPQAYATDGFHPSVEGYKIWANQIHAN